MIKPRKFRTRQARTRERVRIILTWTAASLLGIGTLLLMGWGLSYEGLRINTVHVETDGVLTQEELMTAVTGILDDRHALFIPNDTILFSGVRIVREEVKNMFPRIERVESKRPSTRAVTFVVKERVPAALWCGDVVPEIAYSTSLQQQHATEEAWGACYLMDDTGFVYAKAPIFTGNVFLRLYGPLERATPIGQHFIEQNEFKRWVEFTSHLAENNLTVRAILFVDERDCELYLSNGLRVLIPRNEELEQVRNRLVSAMEEQVIDTDRDIEYVDLRFEGKAFVRYIEIPEITEVQP